MAGRTRSNAFYCAPRPVFGDRGEVLSWVDVKSKTPQTSPRNDLVPEPCSCHLISPGGVTANCPRLAQSGRFSVGTADTIGKRPGMEDVTFVAGDFGAAGNARVDFFALFDGHNGPDAANAAPEVMAGLVRQGLEAGREPEQVLREAFVGTHARILADNVRGGTTALAVLFVGERGWVAHVGDTRAVLIGINKDGERELARLTTDHRPSNADEAQKVRERGGFVISFGGRELRVNGMIAITRALGDKELADALTSEPDVAEIARWNWSTSVLVVACDGLWDFVREDEVLAVMKTIADPEQAAVQLRNTAFRHGSTDNISVMVIDPAFHTRPDRGSGQAPGVVCLPPPLTIAMEPAMEIPSDEEDADSSSSSGAEEEEGLPPQPTSPAPSPPAVLAKPVPIEAEAGADPSLVAPQPQSPSHETAAPPPALVADMPSEPPPSPPDEMAAHT